MTSLASRLQVYYTSKRFLKKKIETKEKNGVLILVGGGKGNPNYAIQLANWMFKNLNANCDEKSRVFSLKTDQLPASQDAVALEKVKKITDVLNKNI